MTTTPDAGLLEPGRRDRYGVPGLLLCPRHPGTREGGVKAIRVTCIGKARRLSTACRVADAILPLNVHSEGRTTGVV